MVKHVRTHCPVSRQSISSAEKSSEWLFGNNIIKRVKTASINKALLEHKIVFLNVQNLVSTLLKPCESLSKQQQSILENYGIKNNKNNIKFQIQ